MKRTCLKSLFLLVVLLSLVITPSLYAASLSLTHIGGLVTNGATYNEWWYSGTNPLLKGTAGEGAEVVITIGTDKFRRRRIFVHPTCRSKYAIRDIFRYN